MIYKKKKKVIFVTATRADFGKLKSLIKILKTRKEFKVYIVVTGMHMLGKFGYTYSEVTKVIRSKIIKFKNQSLGDRLEIILTKTSEKFSKIVKKINPDLIVIHGDRVETLACAVVGSLNHILTAHIEGGEVSGTIDDTIRHAVTKLSHIHFVGSKKAKDRINKDEIYMLDSKYTRKKLNWSPKTNLKMGIIETILFYEKNYKYLKNKSINYKGL